MTRFSHPLTAKLLEVMQQNAHIPPDEIFAHDTASQSLFNVVREHHPDVPIDAFYVLTKAAAAEYLVREALEPDATGFLHGINKSPERYERSRQAQRLQDDEGLNPDHVAILVDDAWNRGTTVQYCLATLLQRGYDMGRTYVYHYNGDGATFNDGRELDIAVGMKWRYPALLPSRDMLLYFDNRPAFHEVAGAQDMLSMLQNGPKGI